MPATMTYKVVLTRVPISLKTWLEDEAENNGRSVSSEVRRILEEARRQREAKRGQKS